MRSDLYIQVFGGLAVERGGVRVAIGGLRQRRLLAALLTERGHVVPTDRLIDLVWPPDEPPPRADRTLQTYVSRLRGTLGPGSVVREHAGYRLDVPGRVVSSEGFATAARVAEDDETGADPIERLAAIDAALSLWHGRPYGDLSDEPFLVPEVTRLTEALLALREARLETLAAIGRRAEALGEAERLMSDAPLRERAYLRAMTLLTESGRTAEALRCYQRHHLALSEATGLEPSETIRNLEAAILAGEVLPAVGRPDTAGRRHGGETLVPGRSTNLPIRNTRLVGRHTALTELVDLMSTHRLVTVTGPAGVGKTTLAVAAATWVVREDADRVAFVDLAPLSAGDVPRAIAMATGMQPDPGLDLSKAVATYLGERRLLLVVDNCEHVLDPVAHLIEETLESGAQVRVLATSREALGVRGERNFRLGPLANADAMELLVERAHGAVGDRRSLDDDAAQISEVCAQLDGLPLAVELAAAQLAFLTVPEIAGRLSDRLTLFEGRREHLDRHITLQRVMDCSWDLLNNSEQQLLRRLAVFSGGFELDAVAGICSESSEPPVERLVRSLVAKNLVTATPLPSGTTRYGLLETIRLYAAGELIDSPDSATVPIRHRRWFAQWCDLDEHTLGYGPNDVTARYLRDFDNIRSAYHSCVSAGETDDAVLLVSAGALIWRSAYRSADALPMLLPLLDQPITDDQRRKLLLAMLGYMFLAGDSSRIARYLPEFLTLWRQGTDAQQAYSIWLDEGMRCVMTADIDGYEECCERFVDAMSVLPNRHDAAAHALATGSLVLSRAGRLERAAEFARRALAVVTPDTNVSQYALRAAAHAAFELGHRDQAFGWFNMAQSALARAGLPLMWNWSAYRAYFAVRTDDPDTARTELRDLLDLARASVPSGGLLPEALTIAGWLALHQNDLNAARRCCERASVYQFVNPGTEHHSRVLASQLASLGEPPRLRPARGFRLGPSLGTHERNLDIELVRSIAGSGALGAASSKGGTPDE